MSRFSRTVALCALLVFAAPAAWAQDSKAAQELRDLRALLEKQSKQIDVLTEQIARLNQALELKAAGTTTPPAAAVVPVATPVAPTASGEFSTDTPKAEPPNGKRHVVIKGETLTSIAKQYNIALPELQKANKNLDERKLQIGQTLNIPPPKTPEPSTEKKEKP